MRHLLFIIIFLFSLTVSADEPSFNIKIFERIIALPSTCVLQLKETAEDHNALVLYKCDKDVNILINKFDYQSLMALQNTVEVTKHTEKDISGITLFHIEAIIDTPLGESHNFIDAFCDNQYCVIALGPSNHIAKSIELQLNLTPKNI